MTDGTNIMMVIGANFQDGKGATTVKELLIGLSSHMIGSRVPWRSLPIEVHHSDEQQPNEFHPQQTLDQIRLQDLVEHLYGIGTIDELSRDTAGGAVAKQLAEKGISRSAP